MSSLPSLPVIETFKEGLSEGVTPFELAERVIWMISRAFGLQANVLTEPPLSALSWASSAVVQ
jgi:hypothetical protein